MTVRGARPVEGLAVTDSFVAAAGTDWLVGGGGAPVTMTATWASSSGAAVRSAILVSRATTWLVDVPVVVTVRPQVYVHVSPLSRIPFALVSPPVDLTGAQPSTVRVTLDIAAAPVFVSE